MHHTYAHATQNVYPMYIVQPCHGVTTHDHYHLIVLSERHTVVKSPKSIPVRTPHGPVQAATVRLTTPLPVRSWRGYRTGSPVPVGGHDRLQGGSFTWLPSAYR